MLDTAAYKRTVALGASHVVNYQDVPEWGQAVFDLTGGVDRVINSPGTGSINQSLAALRPGGEAAVMRPMTFREPLDPMLLMGKTATVRSTAVGDAKELVALSQAIDATQIKPLVGRTFQFDDAKAAYQAQSSRDLFGKIVIEIF